MDSRNATIITPSKFAKLKALAKTGSAGEQKSKIPVPMNKNKSKVQQKPQQKVKRVDSDRPSKIPKYSPGSKKKSRSKSSHVENKGAYIANKDYMSELVAIKERSAMLRTKIDILREKRHNEVMLAQKDIDDKMLHHTTDYYQTLGKIFYESSQKT